MIRFSYFDGFYSNRPHLCACASWEEFCAYMRAISEVEGYKPASDEYDKQQGLISGAVYGNEGDKRCNENVIAWDMMMLDIDNTTKSLAEIAQVFRPYDCIFYSSPSCTFHKLKMRVIVRLDKTAPKEKLKELWYAAQMWLQGIVDEQTKDLSRMMYIPARYTNEGDNYNHFFYVNTGAGLDWEALIAKYPMPPEKERFKKDNPLRGLKRKIFENNNSLPCFDIQSPDCPFVYPDTIKNYLLTPAGGHHKAIYQFMLTVCGRAQQMGYPITIDEVVDMARQVDQLDGGWYDDKKLYNSAGDAMEFIGA